MRARDLGLAMFATAFSVAVVYLPQAIFASIGKTFGVSEVSSKEVFTISAFSYALAFFIFGPLSDVIHFRKLASYGAIATAVLAFSISQIPNYILLLCIVAFMGICAASIPAAMFSMVSQSTSSKAGKYFGLILAATVAGISLGRGLGGVLTGLYGWQFTYIIFAVLILTFGISSFFLPKSSTVSKRSIFGAYLNSFKMIGKPKTLVYLGIGAFLFLGYLGVTTVLTLRLVNPPFSVDASVIGMISMSGLVALGGAPIAGSLVPKIGAGRVSLLGLITCLLGILLIGIATNIIVATIGLLVIYLGVFAAQPALMVRLTRTVDSVMRGAASSIYFLMCLLFGSLGGSLLGGLWSNNGWSSAIVAASISIIASCGLSIYASRKIDAIS